MTDRVRSFTGIHNFRDYGGYATCDGRRVVKGKLFRSGQHHAATVDDLIEIDALDIATVVDLRGDSERRHYPCARGLQFRGTVFYADGETAGAGGAAHAVAARDVRTMDDAHAAMVDLYTFMPHRPNLQRAFRHYFAALADHDGASLVHCFAGKDRTGVAVAMLHRLLGVDDDVIMADYLLTNTAGNSAARIAAGAESIRRNLPDANDAAIATLMAVDAAYLHAAFETIDTTWGGVETYVGDMLGVDAAAIDRLREKLVA